MIAATDVFFDQRQPQPFQIGARWVVIDRLVWRPAGWVKGGRRSGRGRSVPPRFWDGTRWADDYLHALAFDSENATRAYICRIFGSDSRRAKSSRPKRFKPGTR